MTEDYFEQQIVISKTLAYLKRLRLILETYFGNGDMSVFISANDLNYYYRLILDSIEKLKICKVVSKACSEFREPYKTLNYYDGMEYTWEDTKENIDSVVYKLEQLYKEYDCTIGDWFNFSALLYSNIMKGEHSEELKPGDRLYDEGKYYSELDHNLHLALERYRVLVQFGEKKMSDKSSIYRFRELIINLENGELTNLLNLKSVCIYNNLEYYFLQFLMKNKGKICGFEDVLNYIKSKTGAIATYTETYVREIYGKRLKKQLKDIGIPDDTIGDLIIVQKGYGINGEVE